jgi:hypothetical protein
VPAVPCAHQFFAQIFARQRVCFGRSLSYAATVFLSSSSVKVKNRTHPAFERVQKSF